MTSFRDRKQHIYSKASGLGSPTHFPMTPRVSWSADQWPEGQCNSRLQLRHGWPRRNGVRRDSAGWTQAASSKAAASAHSARVSEGAPGQPRPRDGRGGRWGAAGGRAQGQGSGGEPAVPPCANEPVHRLAGLRGPPVASGAGPACLPVNPGKMTLLRHQRALGPSLWLERMCPVLTVSAAFVQENRSVDLHV